MISLRTASQQTWKRVVSVDQAILLGIRRWESALMTRLMRMLTRMGDPAAWVVVGLTLGAVDGAHYAWLLGSGAGLAVAGSQLLKRVFCRPRPTTGMGGFAALVATSERDRFSFPSSHTAAAFGVAAALAGQGSGIALLTLVLAFGIAISRVYLGAHYPLDVAAGVLVGATSGLVGRLLVNGCYHLLDFLGYAGLTLIPLGLGG